MFYLLATSDHQKCTELLKIFVLSIIDENELEDTLKPLNPIFYRFAWGTTQNANTLGWAEWHLQGGIPPTKTPKDVLVILFGIIWPYQWIN